MPTFVFSIQDRRRIHLGDILLLKYPSKIWVEESYIKVMRDGGGGGDASCRLYNERNRGVSTYVFVRSQNYFNKLN